MPLFVLLAAAVAAAPPGPSFDCAKARRADEKLICTTPDLSALDRTVAEAYAAALKRAPPSEAEQIRKASAPVGRGTERVAAGARGVAPRGWEWR